jgi:hypothetical protein
MYSDEILKEKYRVQAEIARENDYDIDRIAEQAVQQVKTLAKKYNIQLHYLKETELDNTA